MSINRFIVFLSFLLVFTVALPNTISPISYGIMATRDGQERYRVLLKCHQDAFKENANVSYDGIDSLYIDIPHDAVSIPITEQTDFAGVVFVVSNKCKDITLFVRKNNSNNIKLCCSQLKKGKAIPSCSPRKKYLLSVLDNNEWVKERKGFGQPVYRKDLFIVKGGIIITKPIFDYNKKTSSPQAELIEINSNLKSFKNLFFLRSPDAIYNTRLLSVDNEYNFEISNVHVKTPSNSHLVGDGVIAAHNCACLFMDNVNINGTYSRDNVYGYGVCLTNIYDLHISNMVGKGNWGIFYTSNLNKAKVTKSDLNRFDLHCYGKDFTLNQCSFTGRANPYSSLYGVISYIDCIFNDTDPVSLRQDYNANTPFDIYFTRCTFNMTESHNCFFRINGLTEHENERPELKEKNLPNIFAKDCVINFADYVNRWFIVVTGKNDYKSPIAYLSFIKIDGLLINGDKQFDTYSSLINTKNHLYIDLRNVYINHGLVKNKMYIKNATFGTNATMHCNEKEVQSFVSQ